MRFTPIFYLTFDDKIFIVYMKLLLCLLLSFIFQTKTSGLLLVSVFFKLYKAFQMLIYCEYCNISSKALFIFTWPKNLVFGQVLFSSACMCLCVCLCVNLYIDHLKKFLTDFDETWQDDV